MTMMVTEYIPIEKIHQFHEILCATGGRHLSSPFIVGKRVFVHYEPGDYIAHDEAWARSVTPIREVRRDQWWRIALRRIGFRA